MFTKVCEKEISHRPRLLGRNKASLWEFLPRNETCESSRRLLDSHRRDKMINRTRTAFVSVAAVAVSMFVLGSDARAKSVPAASPQKYVRYLQQLAKGDMKIGTSLMQRSNSLQSTMNRLKNIPQPGPRRAQRIATQEKTVYNQELTVFSKIHHNTNALLATQADIQALPPQEQAQFANLLSSIQGVVASERGVATPTR